MCSHGFPTTRIKIHTYTQVLALLMLNCEANPGQLGRRAIVQTPDQEADQWVTVKNYTGSRTTPIFSDSTNRERSYSKALDSSRNIRPFQSERGKAIRRITTEGLNTKLSITDPGLVKPLKRDAHVRKSRWSTALSGAQKSWFQNQVMQVRPPQSTWKM